MRLRVILVIALLLAIAPAAASAKGRSKPLDVRQATQVGRAAETNSLNGIYVSPANGNVYVASVGGDEITVHSPKTGKLLDRIGPERGVGGPDDVFITDDGTIYWTEILTGRVGMLKPGSPPKHQPVAPGVNPITMNDEGRLFVGRLFFGSGLYELDPDLEAAPQLLDESLNINAFDFGPDGFLYAPSMFTGEILKIDVDADTPVGAEVVADGFRVPTAAKFNSRGRLHVGEFAEGRVWRLNLDRGKRKVVLDIVGTIDNIAFGADNRLYAAAGSDNQIVRRDHRRVKVLNKAGFGLPGGVAVTPDGDVWLGDFFVMRGFERGPRRWTTSFYDRTDPPGQGFAGAGTVAADGDNLITTSAFSGAVQVLDPATGEIRQDIRTLAAPTNALRHGDTLVAAQLGQPGAGQAKVVNAEDPAEVFLDGVGVPLGLASDGDTLYVGDWATGTVWAVDDSGRRVLASGLLGLEGLAVHRDRLLVVETGRQQVTAIDLATGATTPAITGFDFSARNPQGFLPYGMMSGVAVGDRGSIYVSDDGVNKVYKFRTSRRHRH